MSAKQYRWKRSSHEVNNQHQHSGWSDARRRVRVMKKYRMTARPK